MRGHRFFFFFKACNLGGFGTFEYWRSDFVGTIIISHTKRGAAAEVAWFLHTPFFVQPCPRPPAGWLGRCLTVQAEPASLLVPFFFFFFLMSSSLVGQMWVGDIHLMHGPHCSGGDVSEQLKVHFDKNNRANSRMTVGLTEAGSTTVFSSLHNVCGAAHASFLFPSHTRTALLLSSPGEHQALLAASTGTCFSHMRNIR